MLANAVATSSKPAKPGPRIRRQELRDLAPGLRSAAAGGQGLAMARGCGLIVIWAIAEI